MRTDQQHQRLISELTQLDIRESTKAGYNRYALGIMFRAAGEVKAEVESGRPFAEAFADYFTPTRGMHRVARALNLPLDVDRGRWTVRP